MAPGVPNATNESRLTIGPKPLRDLIDHFPAAKAARSDPQLVWTFEDGEVGLKSMESSIDSRGTSVILPSEKITHGCTGKGQLSTELTISTGEFDIYDIYETPTTIAFHLREFNVGLVTIPSQRVFKRISRLPLHLQTRCLLASNYALQTLLHRFLLMSKVTR